MLNSKLRFYCLTTLSLFLFTLTSYKVLQDGNWVAPTEADQLVNPVKENLKATDKGRKIYQKLCWSCHGAKGNGEGPASASLSTKPANYATPIIQNQTDGALFWKITNGKGQMASFEQSLSDEQRWMLVNYIRVLGNPGVE